MESKLEVGQIVECVSIKDKDEQRYSNHEVISTGVMITVDVDVEISSAKNIVDSVSVEYVILRSVEDREVLMVKTSNVANVIRAESIWPPVIDQTVYGITIYGNVFEANFYHGVDVGQVYKTRELATVQCDRMLLLHQLQVFADNVNKQNNNWVVDYSDSKQLKYVIAKEDSSDSYKFVPEQRTIDCIGGIVFSNLGDVNAAITEFADRLNLLFVE